MKFLVADQKKIDDQIAKLQRLDDRIGRLMSQRVDEEEKLAELLKAAKARLIGGAS